MIARHDRFFDMRRTMRWCYPFMGNFWEFVFGARKGERGEVLPFTRWDVLLSVILGITLMVAIGYSVEPHEGWSLKRCLLVGATMIFAIGTARNRKAVLGCAFVLVAFRMGPAVMIGPHPLFLLAGAIAAGCAAWLLLHDLK